MRLAGAVDREERALLRLALPAAKYLVCKRAPAVVAEALECLGGNGYVEESGLPRLYREAPLNSIWEGSGNVTALDVLRAVTREPESVDAVLAEVEAAAGARLVVRPRRPRAAHRAARARGTAGPPAGRDARAVPAGLAAAAVRAGRGGSRRSSRRRFLPDGPWRTVRHPAGRGADRCARRPRHARLRSTGSRQQGGLTGMTAALPPWRRPCVRGGRRGPPATTRPPRPAPRRRTGSPRARRRARAPRGRAGT